jgi:carbamoyltransferase
MQKTLNLRVKYRESFRPLPSAVLREDVADWFDSARFTLHAAGRRRGAERRRRMTNEGSSCSTSTSSTSAFRHSAVTHVDYSARVQCAR